MIHDLESPASEASYKTNEYSVRNFAVRNVQADVIHQMEVAFSANQPRSMSSAQHKILSAITIADKSFYLYIQRKRARCKYIR